MRLGEIIAVVAMILIAGVSAVAETSSPADVDKTIREWEQFYKSMKKAGIPDSLLGPMKPGYNRSGTRDSYSGAMSVLSGWAEANKTASSKKRKMAVPRALPDFPFNKTRMVGEVRTPMNDEEARNQDSELAYFRSLGYSGVLVVWDGEDSSQLGALASRLKKDGWKVFMAVNAGEDHYSMRIQPVDALRKSMADILPSCDAVTMLWRGASGDHLDVVSRGGDKVRV